MIEGGRYDGKKFRKTVLGGRTCCCLSEPLCGAVTSHMVSYANKRHRISDKSGEAHFSSGTETKHRPQVSRNGRRPPCHQHASCTWIIERKQWPYCVVRKAHLALPFLLRWVGAQNGEKKNGDNVDWPRVPTTMHHACSTLGDTGSRTVFENAQTRHTSSHQQQIQI